MDRSDLRCCTLYVGGISWLVVFYVWMNLCHLSRSVGTCGVHEWTNICIVFWVRRVCLLVGCLTSQQHVSVSQGRICSDSFTCCHTEIQVADQTVTVYWHRANQSQHWPYNAKRLAGQPLKCQFLSHWYDSTPEKSWHKQDSNPGSSASEANALTTRPTRWWVCKDPWCV